MNKGLNILIGVFLLTAFALPSYAQVSNDNEDEVNKIDTRFSSHDFVPGQVLVKFKDANRVTVRRAQGRFTSTSAEKVTAILQKYGTEEMEQLLPNENPNRQLRRGRAFNGEEIQERDLSQLYYMKLSAEHLHETMQIIEELNSLDEVEYAEPNYWGYIMGEEYIAESYGGNPMVRQQWYLDAYGVTGLWDKPIINPERPVIAIIDTGVDTTHPDLKDNCIDGYDFVNNTPHVIDDNMHGTHVAGIAAACNNEKGIVGANPLALIMPVKVLDKNGVGNTATILQGVNYAVEHGAKILNLSLGGYGYSKAAADVYRNASLSAIIVAAAGNDGKCIYASHTGLLKHGNQPAPSFPAAYSFVLGVQATNQKGDLASFSNYDDDGPLYSCESSLDEPDGFNYELKAPGTEILSTLPSGNYGQLQGTSMASPLVAGAISALMMVKKYDSQERLWAELLHTKNIAEAYELTELPADLDVVRIMLRERKEFSDETEEAYIGTNEVKAGETINIYPVIRCTAGDASNVKLKLEVDDNEDPNCIQIVTGEADFGWHLNAMGKAVSKNPLVVKIPEDIADSRHIRLKIMVSCENQEGTNARPFTFIATNMETISGILTENTTLYSGHSYYVDDNLAVNEDVTLTIEPGTRLEFAEGKALKSWGKLVAKGTVEKPIVFTSHHGGQYWKGIMTRKKSSTDNGDTITYCRIESCEMDCDWNSFSYPYMENCLIEGGSYREAFYGMFGIKNVLMENIGYEKFVMEWNSKQFWNIVNNSHSIFNSGQGNLCRYSQLTNCNFLNNPAIMPDDNSGNYSGHEYWLQIKASEPEIDHANQPSYLGTSREDLVRPHLFELGNAPCATWGVIDLSNMRTTPVSETHGIVWKVLVNDKDAQDEYEELAPLGVGRHKFEVYFNRPMNKEVIPQISFGVRDPWTQNGVDEDGAWNDEGTIYTAYVTITGRTKSDGVNRIYVRGAEDDEFFPCPYEKSRFNINVQAAGSMATGFAAEAGMGHVKLTWNNENNDFEDAMGFNIYRFNPDDKRTIPAHYDENWNWIEEQIVVDTIRINEEILSIETSEYADCEVTPNHTYYYMYKVISTDLKEYDVSNIVAATPLTATLGDANGSGEVDVADVVTTVNYVVGMKPEPFVFDAADMNIDQRIDVLDVIGIVQKVLHPNGVSAASVAGELQAVYTVEDGVLYVESPVALGGVQVQLTLDGRGEKEEVRTTQELNGFEQALAWLSDEDYLLLAYNMNGKTLSAGKHALLYIGDADITQLRLADAIGHPVNVIAGEGTTNIEVMGSRVQRQEGIYDLQGRKLSTLIATPYSQRENSQFSTLKKGVYIINGQKVVK